MDVWDAIGTAEKALEAALNEPLHELEEQQRQLRVQEHEQRQQRQQQNLTWRQPEKRQPGVDGLLVMAKEKHAFAHTFVQAIAHDFHELENQGLKPIRTEAVPLYYASEVERFLRGVRPIIERDTKEKKVATLVATDMPSSLLLMYHLYATSKSDDKRRSLLASYHAVLVNMHTRKLVYQYCIALRLLLQDRNEMPSKLSERLAYLAHSVIPFLENVRKQYYSCPEILAPFLGEFFVLAIKITKDVLLRLMSGSGGSSANDIAKLLSFWDQPIQPDGILDSGAREDFKRVHQLLREVEWSTERRPSTATNTEIRGPEKDLGLQQDWGKMVQAYKNDIVLGADCLVKNRQTFEKKYARDFKRVAARARVVSEVRAYGRPALEGRKARDQLKVPKQYKNVPGTKLDESDTKHVERLREAYLKFSGKDNETKRRHFRDLAKRQRRERAKKNRFPDEDEDPSSSSDEEDREDKDGFAPSTQSTRKRSRQQDDSEGENSANKSSRYRLPFTHYHH